MAIAICFRLLWQTVRLPRSRTVAKTGNRMAAITATMALASDANGIPVASTTSATELGYVTGVTSAIQTQINSKQATGNYVTALTGDVVASGPGSASASIQAGSVTALKLATGAVDLTGTKVTGTLPVGSGGTNSTTALSNNRVMQSSGGKIVEAAALTASRALASDVNGIPVATATTTTELGYVAGVTGAIQAQFDALTNPTFLIKTASYTAQARDNIIADTTGGAFTITLPASPVLGSTIKILDGGGVASVNAITVNANGLKILGGTSDLTIDVDGSRTILLYYNSSRGWILA